MNKKAGNKSVLYKTKNSGIYREGIITKCYLLYENIIFLSFFKKKEKYNTGISCNNSNQHTISSELIYIIELNWNLPKLP